MIIVLPTQCWLHGVPVRSGIRRSLLGLRSSHGVAQRGERRGACGVRVALLDDDDAYEDGSIQYTAVASGAP